MTQQSNTGHHAHTFTSRDVGILEPPNHLLACFWEAGGNQRTRKNLDTRSNLSSGSNRGTWSCDVVMLLTAAPHNGHTCAYRCYLHSQQTRNPYLFKKVLLGTLSDAGMLEKTLLYGSNLNLFCFLQRDKPINTSCSRFNMFF